MINRQMIGILSRIEFFDRAWMAIISQCVIYNSNVGFFCHIGLLWFGLRLPSS